jgi:membrane-bound inhibitor of C-type lysozyme
MLALLIIGSPIYANFAPAPLYAQDEPATPAEGEEAPQDEAPAGAEQTAEEAPSDAGAGGAPSYDDIIAAATTQEGVFKVHQIEDSWLWELPADLLGKDMFWYAELSQVPVDYVPSINNTTVGARMVRFVRRGNVIDVLDLSNPLSKRETSPRDAEDQPTSDEKHQPVQVAIAQSASPALILSFPIIAEGPEGSVIVDATQVFSNEIPDFSPTINLALSQVPVDGVVPDRSYVAEMRAFPENVDVASYLTYARTPNPLASILGAATPSTASIMLRHSITKLPEDPMTPRYADPRVGYFTTEYDDYSGEDANGVATRKLIQRYRLEKQDPSAEISDPVEPIVYYISPEVPDKWRLYFKQAVEDWQPAFEAAGFSNAIVALDAPSPEEDPDWSPFDTRYSVIRWLAQPLANAQGPNIHDPRTGEILAAHVLIWADVLDTAEEWYFTQASAVDEQGRTLPLDEELMGRIMRYVVSHEVGHTLGLRHNHRASQVYTIEQLRDPEFTAANGTSPSIMSYGRFNYIAQPEDGVTNLIPQIGPYDHFAIAWGYAPIEGATSPEDEVETLDQWAARQLEDPRLVFGGEDAAATVDPNVLTENLGADRIEATRLGILNLERIMGYIVDSTTDLGSDFSQLEKMYNAVLGQRETWLRSVTKLVGGVEESRTLAGRGGDQFNRVSPERQRAAVAFLMENLETPAAFLPPEVLNQIAPVDAIKPLLTSQANILGALLDDAKFDQLTDAEALNPENAYTAVELLADIQAGLFSELSTDGPRVDPLRRSLQQAYVDHLIDVIAESNAAPAGEQADQPAALSIDTRAAARVSLGQLKARLDDVAPTVADPATRAHLENLRARISAAGVAPIEPAMAEASDTAQSSEGAGQIAVTFACADDVAIDAVFDNASDNVILTMNGETLTLPHVESGSGAKYSDGTTTFWTKGDEAFVQVNDETVISDCVAQSE